MNKIVKQLLILFCLVIVLILPYFVFAETETLKNLQTVAGGTSGEGAYQTGAGAPTIASIAGLAVNVFLSLLGIIFIILTVYGGFNYMTARGDEDKVSKAIATIQRAIIGLIIVFASYAIWAFIFNYFINK